MPVTVVFDLDGTLLQDTPLPGRPFTRWVGTDVLPLPGAVPVLRWCRRQGHHVVLYSMGDLISRLRRLDAAGIQRGLFHALYAVPGKNPDTYRTVLGYHQQRGPLIYVGDSWRNDAAVALGRANAVVWVQGDRETGRMDTPADPERYPVWVVRSVAELPDILPRVLADRYRGFCQADWEKYWWEKFGRRRAGGTAVRTDERTMDGWLESGWTAHDGLGDGWPFADSPWDDPAAELADGRWPVTAADWKDREFALNPPPDVAPGHLAAYERREICGCGDHLISPEEREGGICTECKELGVRTPRP